MKRGCLSNLFGIFFSAREAGEIRKDPERRAKSVRFGVMSLLFSVVSVPVACLMLLFPSLMSGMGAILVVFNVAILLIGAGGCLMFMFNALFYFIVQITINRKLITWLALILFLGALAANIYIASIGLTAL